MSELPYPARGYIDMLLYTLDSAPDLGDSSAAMLADGLIDGRFFTGTVDEFADAVRMALRHGRLAPESLELSRRYGEAELLDFLARLDRRLDELRPWPAPAYVRLSAAEWPDLGAAAPIARVVLPAYQIEGLLNAHFEEVASTSGTRRALVLRLRTGAVVALRGPADRAAASFDLVALEPAIPGAPDDLLFRFQELTGLGPPDLRPVSGPAE